jgi:hypothetical protein
MKKKILIFFLLLLLYELNENVDAHLNNESSLAGSRSVEHLDGEFESRDNVDFGVVQGTFAG